MGVGGGRWGGSCCQKRHLQNFFFFQKYCAPKHVRGLFALVLFSRHFFLIRGCLFFDVLSSLLSLARDRILMNYLEKGWTKCLRCSISKNKGPSFNKNDTYLASSQRPGKRTRVECASFGHQKPVFIPRITYRIFPSFKSSVLNAIERSHFLKRGVFFCFCFLCLLVACNCICHGIMHEHDWDTNGKSSFYKDFVSLIGY